MVTDRRDGTGAEVCEMTIFAPESSGEYVLCEAVMRNGTAERELVESGRAEDPEWEVAEATNEFTPKEMEKIFLRDVDAHEWVLVTGKLDTGAATTVISAPLHGHLCVNRWRRITPLAVKLASQSVSMEVKEEDLIWLKVNNKDFGFVKAILIDDDSWRNVLSGRDLMEHYGFLPVVPN